MLGISSVSPFGNIIISPYNSASIDLASTILFEKNQNNTFTGKLTGNWSGPWDSQISELNKRLVGRYLGTLDQLPDPSQAQEGDLVVIKSGQPCLYVFVKGHWYNSILKIQG